MIGLRTNPYLWAIVAAGFIVAGGIGTIAGWKVRDYEVRGDLITAQKAALDAKDSELIYRDQLDAERDARQNELREASARYEKQKAATQSALQNAAEMEKQLENLSYRNERPVGVVSLLNRERAAAAKQMGSNP